jgi:hypothetical protein
MSPDNLASGDKMSVLNQEHWDIEY